MMAGAAAALVSMACAGDEPSGATGAASSTGTGGGAAGAGGSSGGCTDDPSDAPEGAVCIASVRGRFVDESEQPLADLVVSVCGSIECSPGQTTGDGTFSVEVGHHIRPEDYSTLAHARELEKTAFYFRLPIDASGPVVEVGDLQLLQMPAGGSTLIVDTDMMGAPAQTVTESGVTLAVEDGTAINLGFDDALLGPEGKAFKVLEISADKHDQYIDPALGAEVLYALYPFESRFRLAVDPAELASATLSFPNDAGWPAGTEIEILALGSYIFPDWVTPATFEVVARGAVSSDGMTITMHDGEGVPYLTWFALRETL
jgi:hypothetical protein